MGETTKVGNRIDHFQDRRYRKNHQAIQRAYLELVQQMDPCRITVKDLCEQADVNRSTFYQHYGYLENLEQEFIHSRILAVCELEAHPVLTEIHTINTQLYRESIHRYIQNFMNDQILQRMIASEKRNTYLHMILDVQCHLTINNDTLPEESYEILFQNVGACSMIIEWLRAGRKVPQEKIEEIIYRHLLMSFHV